MNIIIEIKRQKAPAAKPYWERFSYEGDGKLSVADLLNTINQNTPVKTMEGTHTAPIAWECSCGEKKCGACAMLVNGYPRLACASFLCDVAKRGRITLAPLSKFPVVADLKVDRTIMTEMLKTMRVWQTDGDICQDEEENKDMYRSAKCVMCGCCLEVCPNFGGDAFGEHESDDAFYGAFAMAAAFKAIRHNEEQSHVKDMKQAYKAHFFQGCGQSLACVNVCPFDVPHDELQSRLNRRK